jgi:hypothetical protein
VPPSYCITLELAEHFVERNQAGGLASPANKRLARPLELSSVHELGKSAGRRLGIRAVESG